MNAWHYAKGFTKLLHSSVRTNEQIRDNIRHCVQFRLELALEEHVQPETKERVDAAIRELNIAETHVRYAAGHMEALAYIFSDAS